MKASLRFHQSLILCVKSTTVAFNFESLVVYELVCLYGMDMGDDDDDDDDDAPPRRGGGGGRRGGGNFGGGKGGGGSRRGSTRGGRAGPSMVRRCKLDPILKKAPGFKGST